MPKRILVTGGAGFIGSNLIRFLLTNQENTILNLDKLTYAGNLNSLDLNTPNPASQAKHYSFAHVDLADAASVSDVFHEFQPDCVYHLAAETHVDRSIDQPVDFLQSNVVGTYNLIESAHQTFKKKSLIEKARFRFLHVSTDEVYGTLEKDSPEFTESTVYDPRSPYSASKAAADHLVNAWSHTFGLPIVTTHSSNNYGPFQQPEKLIPLTILNAIHGRPISVYGDGQNIRDWMHVDDHVRALVCVMENGQLGQRYNIGSNNEMTNLELVRLICQILDELIPVNENPRFPPGERERLESYSSLIQFVEDRPGHDFRYGVNSNRLRQELGWAPECNFDDGLKNTICWYLENVEWWVPSYSAGTRA